MTFASIKRLSHCVMLQKKKKKKACKCHSRRDLQSTVSSGGMSPSLEIKIANSYLPLVRGRWSAVKQIISRNL